MTTEPTEPRADHVQDAEETTQVQTTKVVVTGMTCGHCVNSVSEELKEIDEQEIWRAGAFACSPLWPPYRALPRVHHEDRH